MEKTPMGKFGEYREKIEKQHKGLIAKLGSNLEYNKTYKMLTTYNHLSCMHFYTEDSFALKQLKVSHARVYAGGKCFRVIETAEDYLMGLKGIRVYYENICDGGK